MNLLLHGLEYPNIDSGNSLRIPLRDIGDKDRVDIILTNPPFGGEEERGILNNFPDDRKTSETALLFLQLIMRKLKRNQASAPLPPAGGAGGGQGGRAAIVVPNGTLFADGVAARIKKQLIDDFNLHTIVRLGEGVFAPYTDIPCNLLFFEQGGPTKMIWYYELLPPADRKKYSKTRPLQNEEFVELKKWWNNRKENDNAWKVKVEDVLIYDTSSTPSPREKVGERLSNVNLDLKNPNRKGEFEYREPEELVSSIMEKEERIIQLMKEIEETIQTTVNSEE